MRNRVGQLILTILEYLPIILTIGFSAYIVLYSDINNLDEKDLLRWILGLFGLLATAILIERFGDIRRIEKFSEATYEYLTVHEKAPSIELIFTDRKKAPPLEVRLQHVKEVVITGASLFRLLNEYMGYFEERAKEGCNLKFLLLDPEGEATQLIAQYIVHEVANFTTDKSQILNSLDSLKRLKDLHPENVEVKKCRFAPPMGMMILDPGKREGLIQVELYTLDVPTRDRPQFIVKANREPYWYNFFLNQYRQMWSRSIDIDDKSTKDMNSTK